MRATAAEGTASFSMGSAASLRGGGGGVSPPPLSPSQLVSLDAFRLASQAALVHGVDLSPLLPPAVPRPRLMIALRNDLSRARRTVEGLLLAGRATDAQQVANFRTRTRPHHRVAPCSFPPSARWPVGLQSARCAQAWSSLRPHMAPSAGTCCLATERSQIPCQQLRYQSHPPTLLATTQIQP